MANLVFKDAERARDAVVASQKKEIADLYEKWAKDIEKQAQRYSRSSNVSAPVSKAQMRQLLSQVKAAGQQTANEVYNTIKRNMYTVADGTVKCNAKWMEGFGFSKDGVEAAFSYVPTDVVERLITGQVYESGWSLSKSIWGANEATMKDIYEIVAKGRAENLSVQEVARQLSQFVSPTAAKKWNPRLVTKNTATGKLEYKRIFSKQVDYNAQRLARTLAQHSYQQSFVAVTKNNPFVEDYVWHSNGSRACELCQDRDGRHFAKDDLPMDHPNGMCVMEPTVADNVADQIADWLNSEDGTYPEIDEFAKDFGYEAKPQVPVVTSNVVNGVDLAQSWQRRPDQFEFEIEDVINAQGFDGLPSVVSPEEFENAVRESNFIAQRTYSAPSQEVLDAYRDQLYHGKWYVDCSTGGAQYGQGMYCAADYTGTLTEGIKSEMEHYATISRERYMGPAETMAKTLHVPVDEYIAQYGVGNSYTETFTLDPSAKIITYDDALYERSRYAHELKVAGDRDGFVKAKEMDIGVFASMRGYDAINAEGHGASGSYTVILNRTKVILRNGG